MYKHSFHRQDHEAFQDDFKPLRRLMHGRFEDYLHKTKGKIDRMGVSLDEFATWITKDKKTLPNDAMAISLTAYTYTHFFWQFTKPEFCIDDSIVNHIVESDVPTKVPAEIAKRLPYWSQWIQAPIGIDVSEMPAAKSIHPEQPSFYFPGAFVSYFIYNGRPFISFACRILCDVPSIVDPDKAMFVSAIACLEQDFNPQEERQLTASIVNVNRSVQDKVKLEQIRQVGLRWARQMLNCVLFICSQEESLAKQGAKRPVPKREASDSYRLKISSKPRQFDVGQEFVEEIREYERAVSESRRSGARRAHIRRGHHHNFWTGPKAGPRKLISKWLPPKIVKGTKGAE